MSKILLIASIFGFFLAQAVNQETGWSYYQASNQAFYFFERIEIDGQVALGSGCTGSLYDGDPCDNLGEECGYCCENPGTCDVIGAFYNNECIGWVYAKTAGYTTLPVMGIEYPGYPEGGEDIEFRIYDSTEESMISFYLTTCYNNQGAEVDCSWSNLSLPIAHPISFAYPVENDGDLFYVGDIIINDFLDNEQTPSVFNLLSAYPNPFNPSINIDFYIESNSLIDLKVYDMLGSLVDTLILGEFMSIGNHSSTWTPDNNISTGEYIVSLSMNGIQLATQKIAYIK